MGHFGHLGAGGGPGLAFLRARGPKHSPLFELTLALLRPRTLRGATLDVKKLVLKAYGCQVRRLFVYDLCSDVEVPGTGFVW